jgi:hypothetical protein
MKLALLALTLFMLSSCASQDAAYWSSVSKGVSTLEK